MYENLKSISIPKKVFEDFLREHYYFYQYPSEYYLFDWEDEQKDGKWQKFSCEIKEYCYIIPIAYDRCIKIYSSINREGKYVDVSRGAGEDRIRFVIAYTCNLEPVYGRLQRMNRVGDIEHWQQRFVKRIDDNLRILQNSLVCPSCYEPQKARGTWERKKNFLGCSQFPYCRRTSDILVFGINRNYPTIIGCK